MQVLDLCTIPCRYSLLNRGTRLGFWSKAMEHCVWINMYMQVAERAGVVIETGCNTGSCGICEVRPSVMY